MAEGGVERIARGGLSEMRGERADFFVAERTI